MVTAVEDDPFTEMIRSHERQLLDEELQQLPEIYRAPLVLHYFEQRSNLEISQWLGVTVAAVESRLKRAKQLLRARLVRRGMTLSVAVAALGASSSLATATPSVALVSSTVTLAATTPAITTSLTTVAASAVLQLAAKELATMSAATKITALLLTTAGTLTLGGAVLFGAAYGGRSGEGQGTSTSSLETNGIVETDAELGLLAEEPQLISLAMLNDPPRTAIEAPTEAKVESPKATEPPPQENADFAEKVKRDTQKIRDALNQPTKFEFIKTPLKEAIASMSEKCGISIKLDTRGINDIAINEDTPIDLVVEGITLRSALKLMLENSAGEAMDYILEDGALIVGTTDSLSRKVNEQYLDEIVQKRLGVTSSRTHKSLDELVDFNLPDTTLASGLRAIAEKCGITILLSGEEFQEAFHMENSPVSLIANGIPMRAALSKVLNQVKGLELFYLVDNEVLRVGTRDTLVKTAKSSRLRQRFAGAPESFLIEHDPAVTMASTIATPTKDTAPTLASNSKETENAESSGNSVPSPTQPSQDTSTVITGNNIQITTKRTQLDVKGVPVEESPSGQSGTSSSEHRAPILAPIRNLTAADRKVYEALDQTAELEFPDNNMDEVTDYISSLKDIRIRVDWKTLSDEGITPDASRVNLVINEVPLSTSLSLLLESVDNVELDYYVDQGILMITTAEQARQRKSLRFYDLSSELVNLPEVIEAYAKNFEASEPGTLELTSFGDCLAIETSFAIHKKIEEMIVGVMQVAEARKAAGKELVIPKPKPATTQSLPAQSAPTTGELQQPAGSVGGSGAAGGIPAGNPGGGFIGGGGGGFN